jgi:hypothetical protein
MDFPCRAPLSPGVSPRVSKVIAPVLRDEVGSRARDEVGGNLRRCSVPFLASSLWIVPAFTGVYHWEIVLFYLDANRAAKIPFLGPRIGSPNKTLGANPRSMLSLWYESL